MHQKILFKSFKERLITSIILFLLVILTSLYTSIWIACITLTGLFIGYYETPQLYKKNIFLKTIAYPGISTALLILHTIRSTSWILMLQPYIFAWTADCAGYLIGNLLGKHKLCPSISPGKTIEGFIGSLIATSSLGYLVFKYSLIFGILIGIAAFAGDIFVSWLKRKAMIKDTGSLLPGHGGLLDRMDSVYGVILVLYLLKMYTS